MEIAIQHHAAHIVQRNLNDCWATALAIAMHRHSGAGTQHVKDLALARGINVNADGSLDPTEISRLARAVHMIAHDFRLGRPLTVEFLQRAMRAGAIVVFGNVSYQGVFYATQHALVAYRLEGDGHAGGTEIYFIDPYNGHSQHTNVKDFEDNRVAIDFVLARS